GETVRMISKKYRVAPSEIYRDNKFAIDGIREGMVLQIFVPKKETSLPDPENNDDTNDAAVYDEPSDINHTVAKGETLFGIAKQYQISVEEIKNNNLGRLERELKEGQVLTIKAPK